jgi:hypothetical protein
MPRKCSDDFCPCGGQGIVMVDHSIFRIDRGALGMINIAGDPGPQIFHPHDSSKGWQ